MRRFGLSDGRGSRTDVCPRPPGTGGQATAAQAAGIRELGRRGNLRVIADADP